ncbi:hypothetical protein BOTBODRAFT_487241 [Botryobasidium botryosum FD-172 SS1]|uniref:F-box domain-containing protein n=1 Tax=Botryobasidium botryosum (strain FD-172 SS1) TaxID=930990 RepID=A0A067M4F1_BOTB1|nr:hypothetical protein BOTBODRAFT_487241 [Botryobasidium botryosum FD-172 SS1]
MHGASAEELEILGKLVAFVYDMRREENAGNTFEAEDDNPTWTPDPEKCSVCKLPSDILVAIFNLVVDEYRDTSRRLDTVRTRALLNIARVCKSWREVALDTPSLWTQIGPSSAPFINTFLARSGSELLDIYWEPTKLPGPTDASGRTDLAISFFRPLRDHVHRLNSLDIWWTSPSVYEVYLNRPAPNIERIYASHSDAGMRTEPVEPSNTSHVLFGGHAPRLRELCFSFIYISLHSPILSNLTNLAIEHVVYTRSKPSQLIRVLNACPALETFQLTNIHFDSAFPDPTTRVELPLLKDFFLYEMPLKVVRYILASIVTSPTACLSLQLGNATLNTAFPPNVDYATRFPKIPRIRRLCVWSRYRPFEGDNIEVAGYDSSGPGDST